MVLARGIQNRHIEACASALPLSCVSGARLHLRSAAGSRLQLPCSLSALCYNSRQPRLQQRQPQRQPQRQRRSMATAASAAGAAAAVGVAWGGAGHAAHSLLAKLGASAAQIGAYLPFLPAAVHVLQSVPLPSVDLAGADMRTWQLIPMFASRSSHCSPCNVRA